MRPDNYIYERYYYRRMRQTYSSRRRWWPEKTAFEILKQANSLYAFDNLVTAPGFGYRDAADYYKQNSAQNFLGRIKIPTRIIHAVDDPIIPFEAHSRGITEHPHVEWILTAQGGHVGFINQKALAQDDQDFLWAENRMLDFAESVLKMTD